MHAAAEPQPLQQPRPSAALEALFAQHHDAVFRAAYRITGNAMDAEDVLQTVFVRLLGRAEELDPAGASSYLHRAAVNAALDLLRRRKRSRAVGLDDLEEELVDQAQAGPEREGSGREIKERLRSALSRLSPRAAEIFTLRYFDGASNLEIARMLGSSQTAVAVILHRARHRLQKELAPLHGGWS